MAAVRRCCWILGVLAQIAGGRAAGAEPLQRFEFRQTHMGSEFKVILYTGDEANARRASDAVFARVAQLDKALSDYDPESELMRLCDRAGGPPVAVSEDLFRVLAQAREMARMSDGAFDPTVNPVVRLWRRARRERKLPDPATLDKARALVGYENLDLDPRARTAQLRKPGMKLDLGGSAKGDASDQAIAQLKRFGIDRALVAAAGDIVVSGPPPDAAGWVVAIEPLEPGAPTRAVLLVNAAVSTSGDAERFVIIDDKRFSHIVDPHTGLGMIERASVTVVAPSGGIADSLDTAVYVLGPKRGLELVESIPGAAAFIARREGERIAVHESKRWADLPRVSPQARAGTASAVPRAG